MDAIVIFSSESEHWAHRVLHPRFSHVWCVVKDRIYWVSYNWRNNRPLIRCEAEAGFDIAGHYARMESTTAVMKIRRSDRAPRPLLINNCVGHTKLVCGIDTWAATPHQLYQHLLEKPHEMVTAPRYVAKRPRAAAPASAAARAAETEGT